MSASRKEHYLGAPSLSMCMYACCTLLEVQENLEAHRVDRASPMCCREAIEEECMHTLT